MADLSIFTKHLGSLTDDELSDLLFRLEFEKSRREKLGDTKNLTVKDGNVIACPHCGRVSICITIIRKWAEGNFDLFPTLKQARKYVIILKINLKEGLYGVLDIYVGHGFIGPIYHDLFWISI